MVQKVTLIGLTFVMALMFSAGAALSEEKTSGSGTVDLFSHYVWRGQKLSNSFVVQPSVDITYNDFGMNLWANYDSDISEHNETDLTLYYVFSVEKFSFDAGYIYYALDGYDDTQEVYISAGYDVLLNPTLSIIYDFDEGDGAYITVDIGHSFELTKTISLNLGATVGYNADNEIMGYDNEGDEFSDFYNGEISASLSIPIWKDFSIEPMIAYSFPLSSDAEDAIEDISDDGDQDIFYGGLSIALAF